MDWDAEGLFDGLEDDAAREARRRLLDELHAQGMDCGAWWRRTADLVGFTALGESVPVEELGGVAGRLSRLAAEACDPPVRIVKLIGDAVMLVAPEPRPMLECALRLVAVVGEEENFPELRRRSRTPWTAPSSSPTRGASG